MSMTKVEPALVSRFRRGLRRVGNCRANGEYGHPVTLLQNCATDAALEHSNVTFRTELLTLSSPFSGPFILLGVSPEAWSRGWAAEAAGAAEGSRWYSQIRRFPSSNCQALRNRKPLLR